MYIIQNKLTIGLALVVISFLAPASGGDIEKAIEARQGWYQIISHNTGLMFSMAKGKTEYNAEIALMAAKNLQILNRLNNSYLWPPESSKDWMPGKTRALEEIWSTYPAFLDKIRR